jgi:hypothetical protein
MSTDSATLTVAERERSGFVAACRRHGFRADQFRISGDEFGQLSEPDTPLTREVEVVHLASTNRRRYRRDLFSNWLTSFEDDLRSGVFEGHRW